MTSDAESKEKNPLSLVAQRNAFYLSNYRKVLLVFLISLLMNALLGFTLWYIIAYPQKPYYFATNLGGRIMPVFPLNEPNQSDTSVEDWVSKAAAAAFTYNYSNYRREFQSASGFFTGVGWSQFLQALKSSNNLSAIIQKKMLVSAQIAKRPSVLNRGRVKGRFGWKIKVPLLITYQSTLTYTQQRVDAIVIVVRVSTLNSPSGIGIEQFVVGPAQ
jgi:intracellular multiplication protein IcmL